MLIARTLGEDKLLFDRRESEVMGSRLFGSDAFGKYALNRVLEQGGKFRGQVPFESGGLHVEKFGKLPS